jgi:hypothetical protein
VSGLGILELDEVPKAGSNPALPDYVVPVNDFRPVLGSLWIEEGNPNRVLVFTGLDGSAVDPFVGVFGGTATLQGYQVLDGVRSDFQVGSFLSNTDTTGIMSVYVVGGEYHLEFVDASSLRTTSGTPRTFHRATP